MTRKELEKKFEELSTAIETSHSADFGGISVTVKGESFDCDLSQNEWSGSLVR